MKCDLTDNNNETGFNENLMNQTSLIDQKSPNLDFIKDLYYHKIYFKKSFCNSIFF